jgi:parallel beta-helix repeat protein
MLLSARGAVREVPPAAGSEGIQRALDQVGAGGRVLLGRGTYIVRQPIILRQDGQTLSGCGPETILRLADDAICPVVILGAPLDEKGTPTRRLRLDNLLVDGNRMHQHAENWRTISDGSVLKNDGVAVWGVDGAVVEHVVCRSCRSGGLVTTGGTRRLSVRHYTAYFNQFDGLACYKTEHSRFSRLDLRDNRAAGISLDLDFNNNIIDDAILTRNNLGIFMRASRDNVFQRVQINHSRQDGVFMAQADELAGASWRLIPGTECTGNRFSHLLVVDCGGVAFQVNNESCTNNFINDAQFLRNREGGLSQPQTHPVTVSRLTVR